jgi:hypothetical protein
MPRLAGNAVQAANAPDIVSGGVLIGVESLATIRRLIGPRREGEHIAAWIFSGSKLW